MINGHDPFVEIAGCGDAEEIRVSHIVDAVKYGEEGVGGCPGGCFRFPGVDGEELVGDLVGDGGYFGFVGCDEVGVDGCSSVC